MSIYVWVWVCSKDREIKWEKEKSREQLFFLFPLHQLCGLYKEQMFTSWYCASTPSSCYLESQHCQLPEHTNPKSGFNYPHAHLRGHFHAQMCASKWKTQQILQFTTSHRRGGERKKRHKWDLCSELLSQLFLLKSSVIEWRGNGDLWLRFLLLWFLFQSSKRFRFVKVPAWELESQRCE